MRAYNKRPILQTGLCLWIHMNGRTYNSTEVVDIGKLEYSFFMCMDLTRLELV